MLIISDESIRNEHTYFKVFPKVVPADRETTITIKSLFDHSKFKNEAEYIVEYVPMYYTTEPEVCYRQTRFKVKPVNDVLQISHFFGGEQEHVLSITEIINEEKKKVGDFHIYSLKEDLFKRKPYKGDFHIHSYYSDGKESPAYIAALCRKVGFDFMAITDHYRYFPSKEAQEAYQSVDIDLKIFRGEEIHPPESPTHSINFGGKFSINELINKENDRYQKEVKVIEEKLDDIPEGVDKYQYASYVWIFNKIREAGGLAIFSHPYFIDSNQHYISDRLTSYLLEKQPYDAMELLNGSTTFESNNLQVARYYEERIKGREIPIVGVSDAHGCTRLGWYYTILFSPTLELEDIINNVKGLYSVAVQAIFGESVRVYGPFRLVKYAHFLLREVFPEHDDLCLEEGKLMLKYISGEKEVANRLNKLKGQSAVLLDKYWAK